MHKHVLIQNFGRPGTAWKLALHLARVRTHMLKEANIRLGQW
jgi:hypothetical protein